MPIKLLKKKYISQHKECFPSHKDGDVFLLF